jgi:integrase
MSRRPVQDIRIWNIQDRRSHARTQKPWLVRWIVDGERFSVSYPTKSQADRYRARLIAAQQDGERFDARTGEPASWAPSSDDMPVYEWARIWVKQEWPSWAPNSRRATVESLARFVVLARAPNASAPPDGLRAYVQRTLDPTVDVEEESEAERWLRRSSLSLGELTRENLADIEYRLGLGDKGQALAAQTAGRYRKNARACIRRAVELGRLAVDPWPPAPKGRNRRKSSRARRVVDVRSLPDPEAMAALIQAMRSHQPGSHAYQLMTAVMYYGGLRPSEVVMLRPRALVLPDEGWGAIEVVEADIDFDEPGEPKTGNRTVPIPPELAQFLAGWIRTRSLKRADLLFRTRNDKRPTQSNWGRCLHRACRNTGRASMRVYDCRHACATAWLRAGVPLGEAARRLGHSVETLVTVYVGALDSDDLEANRRIDAASARTRSWMVSVE